MFNRVSRPGLWGWMAATALVLFAAFVGLVISHGIGSAASTYNPTLNAEVSDNNSDANADTDANAYASTPARTGRRWWWSASAGQTSTHSYPQARADFNGDALRIDVETR